MEIRNLMEDTVQVLVDEIFEEEAKRPKLGYCTCDQCRLDVACYALNRIQPEYIVSSRGLAYSEREGLDKVQRRADIISIVKDGWSKVSHSPRPTADHNARGIEEPAVEGPVFNFPSIMGRAFDGRSFTPLAEGRVSLLEGGSLVPMVDSNWQNPFVLAGATIGTFIFWPAHLSSVNAGEERTWIFEIKVETPGLESLSHFIELSVTSEGSVKRDFSLQRVHKVPDLHLFPEGKEEDE
jgi:competence protein ComFB